MLNHQTQLDCIVSSPAVRAKQTAQLLAKGLNFPQDHIVEHASLYGTNEEKMFEVFFEVPQQVNHLMIVGHNPDITYFANQFLEEPLDYLPTSAVVCVEFDVENWGDVSIQQAKQKFYITPRMLKEL